MSGFVMHYNFVRPHMGLDGRTPAEAAGIKIVGRDKWMTIIGNTGMYRLAEKRRIINGPDPARIGPIRIAHFLGLRRRRRLG